MNIKDNIELKQFFAGMRTGSPIFLGYLPIGIAFGMIAVNHGFTPFQAILASTVILSGSGQFVALSTMVLSGSVVASVIASTVVNLRYALLSVTLSAHLRGLKMRTLAWLGFTITDETFAVNSAEIRKLRANPSSMMGVGTISWLGWITGTAVGAIGSSYMGDLSAFGIYFAMPAMYAGLFIALANNRKQIYCGIGAGLLVIALYGLNLLGLQLAIYWYAVITSIAAATIAVIVFPDSKKDDGNEGSSENGGKDNNNSEDIGTANPVAEEARS